MARYGNSAKFFTGEAYKRERLPTAVYDHENNPSGIARKLEETLWVEYIKESARLKEDRPKIWGDMDGALYVKGIIGRCEGEAHL